MIRAKVKDIVKKIEDIFVVKENSNYFLSHWSGRLKRKASIRMLGQNDLENELRQLHPTYRYWIVVEGNTASSRPLVYDATPPVIQMLVNLWQGSFYVVDKKCEWILCFRKTM